MRFGRIFSTIALSCTLVGAALNTYAAPPEGFVETAIPRPDGAAWEGAVGITFASDGTMFVWERAGRVWVVDENNPYPNPPPDPLLDISEEVGGWRDFGLLGFALDPAFLVNGHIYMMYVVDRHHLMNCSEDPSGVGEPICGPGYSANQDEYFNATIGRIVRYTVDFSSGMTVDYASRKVLLGGTIDNGIPIIHQSHGTGALVFGTDGTLLASTGDSASYASVDTGSASETYYQQALQDGIISDAENVGAFKSQMLSSLSGKILRLDPETGDGLQSNPFYDAAEPRSTRSRIWALGFRNPFRMTLRPETGSHDADDGNPGSLYIGDVGWNRWEDFNISSFGGENFGWPIFEGMEPHSEYSVASIPNPDAPNPLFGVNGCTQEFFYFRELIVQDTLNAPSFINSCDGSIIPQAIDTHVHTRPTIDWRHNSNNARWPSYNSSGNAVHPAIGQADGIGQIVTGTPFQGNSSTGGVWYTGDDFPPEYRNTYFHADYGTQWVRNFVIGDADFPTDVRVFDPSSGPVVSIATHPTDGHLYYAVWGTGIFRVTYEPTGNRAPTAVASADVTFGGSPLAVQFTGDQSTDLDGMIVAWDWHFGDGATSTVPNPQHTFVAAGPSPDSFEVRLTVTDNEGAAGTTTLLISTNNSPPSISITSPPEGTNYPLTAETVYDLTANIFDAEHAAGSLTCEWVTILHHNDHTHAEPPDTSCTTTTVISPLGCEDETYYFRVKLTVTDPEGLSAYDEVTLLPDCANSAPIAADDYAVVEVGANVDIDVVANDFDDFLLDYGSISIVDAPSLGSVTIQPTNGLVTYSPTVSSTATDTFTYTIADTGGAVSNVATVTVAISDTAALPTIDPAGGVYFDSVLVDLSTTTSGATIHYTLDGTEPTQSSSIYGGSSILISADTTVKARAYKDSLNPSSIASESYVIDDSPVNIALSAIATASSEYSDDYVAVNAVNGIIASNADISGAEWATRGEGTGAWLDVNWGGTTQEVGQVILYDRPNSDDHVLSATLSFSDGTTVAVGELPNDGAPLTVDFAPRLTTSIRLTIGEISGQTKNIGLAEIEIYGQAANQAPVANDDSASVFEGQSVVIPALGNDTDDRGLDPASVTVATLPSAGSITAIDPATGDITYTHGGGTETTDSFTYTVLDTDGVVSNEATVTLSISPYLPPTITIASPTEGQLVTDPTVVVEFEKSGDDTAYDHVHVQLDNNSYTAIHDMSATSFDFGTVTPGVHTINVWLVSAGHIALTNPEASATVSFEVGVATPEIAPDGGTYSTAQLVSLSSATAGASIYYTVDGTDPDQTSIAYDGNPILIETDTTLKARAYLDGATPSAITTADYVFQTALENVAPLAIVTASSEYSGSYIAEHAVNGIIASNADIPDAEWATRREEAGAWLDLDWGGTVYSVSRIVFYDRPNGNDHVLSGTLTFSDGTTLTLDTLPNDGSPLTIDFAARNTTSLRFTVDSTSTVTRNVGLAEIEVFGHLAGPQPPVADAGPDVTVIDLDGNGSESVNLDASESADPDGVILNYAWTVDGTVISEGASAIQSGTVAIGTHTVQLEVTDDDGLVSQDTVNIIVDPQPTNAAPVVDAGPNLGVTLGETLHMDGGSVTDDGLPLDPGALSVLWTTVSGPGTATWPLGDQDNVHAHAEFPSAGTYILRLTADDGQLTAFDEIQVTVDGDVAAPTIDPAGGVYFDSVLVDLSTTTSGATIHYTLDGTEPTQSSSIYGGSSILISADTTVKARAYKDSLNPSSIASESYVIDDSPVNIALSAIATASSEYSDDYVAVNAVNGIIASNADISGAEWATRGEGTGAWLDVNWGGTTQEVGQVILYDRPNSDDHVLSATLSFSDGTTVAVGELPNDGAPLTVDFAPRLTTSIRLTIGEISGQTKNIGLAEIEIYGQAANQAPVANDDSASVFEGQSVVIPALGNDTDDRGLDPASVTVATLPSAGSITAIDPATGDITYTHGGGTETTDSFTYTVLDTDGVVSNEATVTLSISPYLPPTITIASPTEGQLVTDPTVVVEFEKSGDDTAYDHVHVQLDNNSYTAIHDMSATSFDFGTVTPGVHTINVWLVSAGHIALTNPEASATVSFEVGVATPEIAPDGGTYSTAQLVSLSSATAGASIYYTVDGTDPDQTSIAYDGNPILIETDTTLKARAYLDGATPSAITTADYVFQTALENVAPLAIVTASSEYSGSYIAEHAVNGIIASNADIPDAEWATRREEAGAWLDLDWGGTVYSVSRIVFYDRPNGNDHVLSGTLTFSDGTTLTLDTLPNDGSPLTIDFAARNTTSLRFTVDSTSTVTRNVGLAEIEVFGPLQ